MFVERCGSAPRTLRPHAERAVAVGVLLALTACASDQTARYSPSPFGDTQPTHTVEVRPPRVETEADGLPVQPPPLRRTAGQADDPREPWSPNYGTAVPTRVAEAPPAAPMPARVALVIKTPSPMADARPIDEEDIIRRAIAAHEMRRED